MPKTVDRGEGLSVRRGLPKSSIYRAAVSVPVEPPPVTLNTLLFSSTSFADNLSAGDVIANVTGKTFGSTLAISPNDGKLVFNGAGTQLLVGSTPSTAGTTEYTFTETLGEVTKDTVQDFTVTHVVVLNDLVLSSTTFEEGTAAGTLVSTISGKTAGSTLSISPNDGRLAFNGAQDQLLVGLTASSAGTTDYTITETLAGSTPHDTTFTLVVSASVPAGEIPILTPSASYTGTQLSGFTDSTPPEDPVRVTGKGKPAMGFIYGYAGMTVAENNELVGIEAEAVGGVAYVDVYFENSTPTRVQRSKQNVYNPSTGATEPMVAYWFYLQVPEGQRANGNMARVFAKAVPNDPNMQERVLGWYGGAHNTFVLPADTAVPGFHAAVDSGEEAGRYEFYVFPRPTRFAATKHVKADGTGDYTNLQDALIANALANGAVYPGNVPWDIVLHDADVEGGIASSLTGAWGGRGGLPTTRIRAAAGVDARIHHGDSWDPYNTVTVVPGDFGGTWNVPRWELWLPVSNLEFYGGAQGTNPAGEAHGSVTIDYSYFNKIVLPTEWPTVAVVGAKLTNKVMVDGGDMFAIYQNGQIASSGGFGYVQNNASIKLNLICNSQEFVSVGYGSIQEFKVSRVNGFGNPHDNAHVIVDGYIGGYDGTYAITSKPAIRVSYTGAGTTAKVRITYPTGDGGDRLLELQVDDATVASVTLRNPTVYTDPVIGTATTGNSVATMTQLSDWINAQSALGFACVEPPVGPSTAHDWFAFTVQQGGGAPSGPFLSSDIKAATSGTGYLTLYSWQDSHNEGRHLLAFGGGLENALMLRCVEEQCHWSTGHDNLEIHDDGSGGNLGRDIINAYCVSYATNHSWSVNVGLRTTGDGGDGNLNGVGLEGDHTAEINCTMDNSVHIRDTATLIGTRSGVDRTVATIVDLYDGGTWSATATPLFRDTAYRTGVSPPTAPYAVDSWEYASGGWSALYVSGTDFRPAPAGELASHKVTYDPSLQAYDVTGTAFAANDYIGAFAGAASSYVRPLATFSDATYPMLAA